MTQPIYLIGDSHVRVFIEDDPETFKSSRTDIEEAWHSKSAHAIGDDGYLNESLSNIPDKAMVLLSFGEIDCRHYVPKIVRETGRSVESVVQDVVARYTERSVRLLSERFRVIILGAYLCPDDYQHSNAQGSESYSNTFDSILEAKTIFNAAMELYCKAHGLLFIPIFREITQHALWPFPLSGFFGDSSHMLGSVIIPFVKKHVAAFQWP